MTEKIGKFYSKAFAADMKGVSLSVKNYPDILMSAAARGAEVFQ